MPILPEKEIIEIITAQNSVGTPALFLAMMNGQTDNVKIFMQEIQSLVCNHIIHEDNLVKLLQTKSAKEGANKQVISSQADSLIKISRIWADFFPANNRISLFRLFFPPFLALFPVFTEISPTDVSFGPPETGWPG